MASNSRVLNLTTSQHLKPSQAISRIDQCLSRWVHMGISICDLTLAEMVCARAEQSKLEEPLEMPEVAGITWEPPIAERSYTFLNNRRALIAEARQFASQAIAQL
jgi:hypothetical protein